MTELFSGCSLVELFSGGSCWFGCN